MFVQATGVQKLVKKHAHTNLYRNCKTQKNVKVERLEKMCWTSRLITPTQNKTFAELRSFLSTPRLFFSSGERVRIGESLRLYQLIHQRQRLQYQPNYPWPTYICFY